MILFVYSLILSSYMYCYNSNFVELLLEFMLHLMLIYSERKNRQCTFPVKLCSGMIMLLSGLDLITVKTSCSWLYEFHSNRFLVFFNQPAVPSAFIHAQYSILYYCYCAVHLYGIIWNGFILEPKL